MPTLRTLNSMANALGVDIAELVREEEDQIVNELFPVVRSLNQMQRAEILHMVQQLSTHGVRSCGP